MAEDAKKTEIPSELEAKMANPGLEALVHAARGGDSDTSWEKPEIPDKSGLQISPEPKAQAASVKTDAPAKAVSKAAANTSSQIGNDAKPGTSSKRPPLPVGKLAPPAAKPRILDTMTLEPQQGQVQSQQEEASIKPSASSKAPPQAEAGQAKAPQTEENKTPAAPKAESKASPTSSTEDKPSTQEVKPAQTTGSPLPEEPKVAPQQGREKRPGHEFASLQQQKKTKQDPRTKMMQVLKKDFNLSERKAIKVIDAAETLANWQFDKHGADEPQTEANLKALTLLYTRPNNWNAQKESCKLAQDEQVRAATALGIWDDAAIHFYAPAARHAYQDTTGYGARWFLSLIHRVTNERSGWKAKNMALLKACMFPLTDDPKAETYGGGVVSGRNTTKRLASLFCYGARANGKPMGQGRIECETLYDNIVAKNPKGPKWEYLIQATDRDKMVLERFHKSYRPPHMGDDWYTIHDRAQALENAKRIGLDKSAHSNLPPSYDPADLKPKPGSALAKFMGTDKGKADGQKEPEKEPFQPSQLLEVTENLKVVARKTDTNLSRSKEDERSKILDEVRAQYIEEHQVPELKTVDELFIQQRFTAKCREVGLQPTEPKRNATPGTPLRSKSDGLFGSSGLFGFRSPVKNRSASSDSSFRGRREIELAQIGTPEVRSPTSSYPSIHSDAIRQYCNQQINPALVNADIDNVKPEAVRLASTWDGKRWDSSEMVNKDVEFFDEELASEILMTDSKAVRDLLQRAGIKNAADLGLCWSTTEEIKEFGTEEGLKAADQLHLQAIYQACQGSVAAAKSRQQGSVRTLASDDALVSSFTKPEFPAKDRELKAQRIVISESLNRHNLKPTMPRPKKPFTREKAPPTMPGARTLPSQEKCFSTKSEFDEGMRLQTHNMVVLMMREGSSIPRIAELTKDRIPTEKWKEMLTPSIQQAAKAPKALRDKIKHWHEWKEWCEALSYNPHQATGPQITLWLMDLQTKGKSVPKSRKHSLKFFVKVFQLELNIEDSLVRARAIAAEMSGPRPKSAPAPTDEVIRTLEDIVMNISGEWTVAARLTAGGCLLATFACLRWDQMYSLQDFTLKETAIAGLSWKDKVNDVPQHWACPVKGLTGAEWGKVFFNLRNANTHTEADWLLPKPTTGDTIDPNTPMSYRNFSDAARHVLNQAFKYKAPKEALAKLTPHSWRHWAPTVAAQLPFLSEEDKRIVGHWSSNSTMPSRYDSAHCAKELQIKQSILDAYSKGWSKVDAFEIPSVITQDMIYRAVTNKIYDDEADVKEAQLTSSEKGDITEPPSDPEEDIFEDDFMLDEEGQQEVREQIEASDEARFIKSSTGTWHVNTDEENESRTICGRSLGTWTLGKHPPDPDCDRVCTKCFTKNWRAFCSTAQENIVFSSSEEDQ